MNNNNCSSKINLEENNLELLKKILNEALIGLNINVYLYGSRSKGNAYKYSDIDLALQDINGKIPTNLISKLSLDFEESLLPYKVDLIDLYSKNKNFKKEIMKDAILIRCKNNTLIM